MKNDQPKRPSRTRGYYTFRKDYPGGKQEGFPADAPPPRLGRGGKLLVAICAVLLFVIAFVGTDLWILQAKREPREAVAGTGVTLDGAEEWTAALTQPEAKG